MSKYEHDIAELKSTVHEIKDNDLPHIRSEIRNLRWFIFAMMSVFAISVAIAETLG